ncbi:YrhB domain-containing protein [Streptomyces sp. NPDC008163]|uniref:YrhB domain-containing protein n=1 Tax=Streptomyces sp. NPDC008163 TaxID=3364818 RepID=UPI0036E81F49
MIEREEAVRLVEEQLEREHRAWLAKGVEQPAVAVAGAEEHELVWIVSWQSVDYLRTGDFAHLLIGVGPYLVDRVDGSLHRIGAVSAVSGAWQDDYRGRIRGLPLRTAVDDLHDAVRAVAAEHGRPHAARVLRAKVPGLSPAAALAYANALLGAEPPAHLVAAATAELVEPVSPVERVETVRPGRAPQ